ncbi:ribonuclease H-like domain-containing protein [Brunnivagina elsteri]|uniref:Ribonuclease D n=1 Tax=Brunnivagina elsteri CCALA 953 TaxID=987040 RepID=A0A2A2TPL5_9CYAN|nr:ribonuclease H-like domain-containing protein [Calothrix elsteri]PAX60466.1 ribonuclease D [Calothrix elsteri CCALA 953]
MTLPDFQVCDRDINQETLSTYLQSDALAVDTETMGLIPHRDRLCLVQLCDNAGKVTAIRIIRGQTEAPNLQNLLEAANVTKIFHFARFDIATLRYYLGINVNPVFCTKIASKLARTYTNRHGLKDLILELEKTELDKSAQSSDWGNAAHLTEAQLSYAANDVRYLISARQKLISMLQREERYELAEQCFQCLYAIVTLDLMQFKDLFEH